METNTNADIIHPELSYKIVGILYKVYNTLGGGYQERIYQAAIKRELIRNNVGFVEQPNINLTYNGDRISYYRLDFIIEDKIVLELKVTPRFTPRDIMQVLGYLKKTKLKLGILVSLNRNNIHFKRILRGKKCQEPND